MADIGNHTRITVTSRKTGRTEVLLETRRGREDSTDPARGPFIVAGIPIAQGIDDSLDTLTFTVRESPTRKLYRPFDLVRFTVNCGGEELAFDFCVLSDSARLLSRMHGNYEHTVTCIEMTKILEKVKLFNLNLTNPYDGLLRQLEKALNNADPPVTADGAVRHRNRFSVSEELRGLLEGVPGEDFRFGNTDLRTVLDGILSKVNCRACVTKIELSDGDLTGIEIGYRSMTAVRKIDPVWDRAHHGEIVGEEFTVHGQDVAGTIVARGYNAIPDVPLTVTSLFKTKEYRLTTDNGCALLPFPVSEKGIEGFRMLMGFEVSAELSDGASVSGIFIDFPVDIASRLLPDEQYSVLSETDRRGYLPYQIGSDTIGVGDTYRNMIGWEISKLGEILRACTIFPQGEELRRLVTEQYALLGNRTVLSATCDRIVIDEAADGDWNPFNRPFTITYYPLADIVADISKPNTYDEDDRFLGIMDNQSENTLDFDRQGRRLQSLIGRTGNDEYTLDVQADRFTTLLPLMSKIDLPADGEGATDRGYVLYRRECAVHDGFVKCRYCFSKNYNAVQEAAGVRREKHLYDIPLESDECPLVMKSYLVFGTAPGGRMKGADEIALARNAARTLTGETGGREYAFRSETRTATGKICHLLFRTRLGDGSYLPENGAIFMLPTINYAQGKTMNFAARPLDNDCVDYRRGGYEFSIFGDKGKMILYAPYVSGGVRDAGEFSSVECKFAYEYGGMTEGNGGAIRAALESSPVFSATQQKDFCYAEDTFTGIGYRKDRTQRPLFCKIVECVPEEEDFGRVIVGSAFCRDNRLVLGESSKEPKLFVSTERELEDGDETLPPRGFTECGPAKDHISVTVDENGEGSVILLRPIGPALTLPQLRSWAIADESGEIYLAANTSSVFAFLRVADKP